MCLESRKNSMEASLTRMGPGELLRGFGRRNGHGDGQMVRGHREVMGWKATRRGLTSAVR